MKVWYVNLLMVFWNKKNIFNLLFFLKFEGDGMYLNIVYNVCDMEYIVIENKKKFSRYVCNKSLYYYVLNKFFLLWYLCFLDLFL